MTSPISIDKALTIDDCAELLALVQAHIEYERSGAIIPFDWAGRIGQFVADGRLILLTARADGEVVGYASITTDVATWTGQPFAHLDCVYVAGEHRGEGIGRLLVDAASEEARSRGHQELQWQTPDWNADAIRFYERFGATHQPKERFTLTLR